MPRSARIVVPGQPHHITQRGNRRQAIFLRDDDWPVYKALLANACTRHAVDCLAWCLMPNHVHIILVPPSRDALRAVLASVHTAYSQRINQRQGLVGHLFQGRYASYPMELAHLMAAMRYVENNPVAAGLAQRAVDWRWSSAAAHAGRRGDGLIAPNPFADDYPDWGRVLSSGWETGGPEAEAIDLALRSGRPQGSKAWVMGLVPTPAATPIKRPRGRPRKNRGQSPN